MAICKVYKLGSYQAVRFPKDFQAELGEYEVRKEGDELILRKVQESSPGKTADVKSKAKLKTPIRKGGE